MQLLVELLIIGLSGRCHQRSQPAKYGHYRDATKPNSLLEIYEQFILKRSLNQLQTVHLITNLINTDPSGRWSL